MPQRPKALIETPVVFLSQDAQLVGMLHQSKGTHLVILCHGFTGSKTESRRIFVEAGRAFASEGLDALRFDFYGSGDSAGDFADTLVSHNIINLRDAMVWARHRGYEKIAVLGLSMGAATAILTLADTPADALITWSAVPDMNNLFQNYISNIEEVSSRVEEYVHEGWRIKKAFWQDAMTLRHTGSAGAAYHPEIYHPGHGRCLDLHTRFSCISRYRPAPRRFYGNPRGQPYLHPPSASPSGHLADADLA